MDAEFTQKLILIFFEKGILAIAVLATGYLITRSIERIKQNESFKNEITKVRIERITKFYDMFSEQEHWVNRIMNHFYYQKEKNELYLTEQEFKIATEEANKISKKIGFELNSMRFWINDDIYWHTVAQLELFKDAQSEIIEKGNFEKINDFKLKLDTLRMNIDKLIPYLKSNQELKLVKYDRSFMYKKAPNTV